MGHVRASGSASIGHRGLGQLDSAIMRSARTNRAIPRLPFQGNETPGSAANDLRLPPSAASLIDNRGVCR